MEGLLILYAIYFFGVIVSLWLLVHLPDILASLFGLLIGLIRGNAFTPEIRPAPELPPELAAVQEKRESWERESSERNNSLYAGALNVLGLSGEFDKAEFVAAYRQAMSRAKASGDGGRPIAVERAREIILAVRRF